MNENITVPVTPNSQALRQMVSDRVEQVLREMAPSSERATKLLNELDAGRAAGKKLAIRINPENQVISVVEIEEVRAMLNDLSEDAGVED